MKKYLVGLFVYFGIADSLVVVGPRKKHYKITKLDLTDCGDLRITVVPSEEEPKGTPGNVPPSSTGVTGDLVTAKL